jgi:hypothetical protein
LPLTLGKKTAQNDLERRPALEFAGDLLDHQQVRKRVLTLRARMAALPKEAPLFEVTKMILGNGGIEAADIPEPVRPRPIGG